MTDNTTTPAPAPKKASKTPAETLTAAIEHLETAAAAYAAADQGQTTHMFSGAGFRIEFMGEQLQKLYRA